MKLLFKSFYWEDLYRQDRPLWKVENELILVLDLENSKIAQIQLTKVLNNKKLDLFSLALKHLTRMALLVYYRRYLTSGQFATRLLSRSCELA